MDMPNSSNRWLVALAVVCAGIIAFGLLISTNTSDDIAYLLGFNFLIALVVWLVFQHTALKRATILAAISSFFVILVALVVSGIVAAKKNQREGATAIREVAVAHSKFAAEVRANPGANASTPSSPIDTTQRAKGEFGEYERLMKGYLADIQAQRNSYVARLDSSGFVRLLDPTRIAGDRSLSQSKKIIEDAKAIVAEQEKATRSLQASFREKLQAAPWNNISVDQVLESYDDGVRKGKPQMVKMWGLERSAVSEYEKIINLLASNRDKWSISIGQIQFSDQATLTQFNQHIETLKAISAEQQALLNASIQATSKALSPRQ